MARKKKVKKKKKIKRKKKVERKKIGKRFKVGLVVAVIIAVGIALFLATDWDGDGLNNFAELRHGTSIFNLDTDGDGISDGREVNLGTNLLIPEYIFINPEQQGDNLIVFGTTSLPANFELTILIQSLGVSTVCGVENHQYEYKLQRSVNAPSANIQILISCDLTNTENSTGIDWIRVNDPPIPDFTYNRERHNVEFTDTSSDVDGTIVSWKWDFGIAGGTSSGQNPTWTYASRGTYEVELTVTDDGGAQATCAKTIAVPDILLYAWGYGGRSWDYELEILDEVDKYEKMSHWPDYWKENEVYYYVESDIKKFVTPDDEKIKELAENLKASYVAHYDMSEDGLADFVLAFVQSEAGVPYGSITEGYYWPYALEVLVARMGVCSGKSILYASLMEALGYHACLILLPLDSHMMAGVHLAERPSMAIDDGWWRIVETVAKDGVEYWPAETTIPWWNLGERYRDIPGWYNRRQIIQISIPV